MSAQKTCILAASDDPKIREMIRAAAAAEGLDSILCGDGAEALESARNPRADSQLKLAVMEAFLPKMDGFEVVSRMQEFPHTQDLPVLMLIGSSRSAQFPSGAMPQGQQKRPTKIRLRADNYLEKPFEQKEIQGAIHSMIKHFRAHNAPHPVTGMQGHVAIEQDVLARFTRGETFAIVWMDINYFRPFNDHFGTDKGDEVIRTVKVLIQDVIESQEIIPKPFVGHVGGDDFVILLPEDRVDPVRAALRERFQKAALQFYPKDDQKKGFYHGVGRDKKEQVFPLMSLSMIAVKAAMENFAHYGQIVSEANELLHQTKIGAENVK